MNTNHGRVLAMAMAVLLAGPAAAQTTRERVRVTTSTTVYALGLEVATEFARHTGAPAPILEPVGTQGSLTLFCGGMGTLHPDIAMASRGMRPADRERCAQNGVSNVLEAVLGYDAQVIVIQAPAVGQAAGPTFAPTREQLWRALAATVPIDGVMTPNPYKQWQDIAPDLPPWPIRFVGPSTRSGQYDSVKTLILDASCGRDKTVRDATEAQRREACETIAADGRYIQVTQLARDIAPRLMEENRGTVGIVQMHELAKYNGQIQALAIDAVPPSLEAIADGSYPLSRTFRMQIKLGNVKLVPQILDFAASFFSEEASSADGIFTRCGLVPTPPSLRQRTLDEIAAAKAAF